ncbi:cytochrome P450 71A9-like [Hibiscus syriacus]|uniref:Cytochrome P450 71A9-like n=1 Tax=Hibiscus syriacus TaxID=106335 RepID=A0A6A3AH75_HIBSY|nr:cytochrome P450 71A9-like [Hibiscus syriacus]
MAADEGNMKIEKFDGADFGFWKMQIEDFLYQKNLYQPLSEKQPEGMKNEDWALPDRQALGVIRLTLSRNITFNIAKEKTTTSLMAALSSMYEKPSASNKVHLMRRLFNLWMAEGASVAQHLNEINTITTQLSSVEIEFDDEVRALILLSSLPDSWNATVTAVSSSSGNSKLKFDDVRDLVLSEEIRRRESGEASTSSALHTESRGRTSERNLNRGRSKSRTGKSKTGKKDFTCYNCGKKCHFKRDCRAPKKNTGAQDSANVIEETGDVMILSVNSPIESWILDSGASFHSTPCREIMENYVSGDFGKVHLADDETLKIVGKGDIRLKLPNQTTWTLKGVRHIPGLKRNLISVGQLDGEGFSTTFSGCEWKITKGALVIARGKKTSTLYITSNLENIIAVADADGKSNLWHQRLGHMSEKGMKTLLSKGKLPDLKNIDVGLCEDCIFGKQKKAMVENETGLKVKQLRSDNGGEYIHRRFRDFYANNGNKIETTVPITPQQNGVAERMNRTLNERARSMRIHVGLPKFLWTKAINTAAYLINRGPSIPLDGRIPEEVWSKKEINLSHLRVFGCISYVHINSAERSKLDAKSNKCVFVGYGGDEFGYRFWDYENRKIIKNRDFIFNENVMCKDRSTIESSTPELRRSSRIPKPTQRYSPSLHYLLLTDNGEPECYDEAMQVDDSIKWESSMKDEMDSLMSNQMWELAELPPGKKALHNKWIYRIKEEHDRSKRYKTRLVVKGFQQKEAFLHGDLEEEIYMRQPEGFIEAGKKNLVCRLKKSLYGLKQAPRQWYKKFDSFMSSNGFTRCQADHCCYIKRFDNNFIILLLYVDDMLVAGSDMQEIINLKQKLSKQFAMKDLGTAKQILGMRIKRDTKSGTLMLSQAEYINKVLSRFNMQDAKPVSTPLGVHFRLSKEQSPKTEEERAHMVKVSYASTIGSLMYAMVCTRSDIAHAVGAVSRYMNNPGKVHWEAIKWILRYLRGTTNKALCFKGGDTILIGYVDADLAGNVDIRRSTTGYVYTLGGTAVSWVSQLQKIVALSTTETEYVVVTEASKEMVWLQSFLEELGKKQENNVLYCDSQSAIHLAKKLSFHSRTKHIQLRPTHGICASVFSIFLALKKPRWHRCKCPVAEDRHRHHLLATCFAFRRWSGSISSHNLISWFEDTLDEFFYVSLEPFTKELWEFIFSELKKKAEFADNPETAKRISSARGEWALTDTDSEHDRSKILRYVSDVPYDESILLWHIATDLCYQTEKEETKSKNGGENLKYMHFSKILSDYMLYLLIFQPTMMSAVAGIAKIRFRYTCAEARIFFQRRNLRRNEDKKPCGEILSVNTDVVPEQVKGDRSKSVFFSASILAKELKRMDDEDKENKWMIMSRVWVELVSYAASRCRKNTHAAEVSKGGQLISFFWLLMVHFGLGEQFQINEGLARAKLIIEK